MSGNGKQCKRTAGLNPWKKGQSGNPKGMTPGTKTAPARTFTEICRQYLSEPIAEGDHRTRAEVLATAMYSKGLKGDTRAASVILDRIDPAIKKIEMTGVVADVGSAMLDRLLMSTVLPIQQVEILRPQLDGHSQNGNGSNGKH